MVIGGVAAGLALLTRLLHLLFVVPLAGAMLRSATRDSGSPRAPRWRAFLLWAFPVLAATAAIGLANFVRFGSVLETGYGAEASSFDAPLLEGLAGQLVSPGKGLLWFCPAVLLGLAGFRGLWRRSPWVAGTILSGSVLLLLATSKYYQWHGGGCWGPRFLVPLLPLWLLPAAEVFSRWGSLAAFGARWSSRSSRSRSAAAALPILVPFDRHVVDVNLRARTFRRVGLDLARVAAPARRGGGARGARADAARSSPAPRRSRPPTWSRRGSTRRTSPSSATARTRCCSGRAPASRSRWRRSASRSGVCAAGARA